MDNIRSAMAYLQSQGWSPMQAAAIIGNLQQESGMGLDPNAFRANDAGPGLHSRGLGQWNRERLAALQQFAQGQGKPANDLMVQLAFVNHELNGSESAAGKRLRAAANIDDATAAMIGFERPQGWTPENPRGGHGWSNRLANAQKLAGMPATPQPGYTASGFFTQPGSYSGGEFVPEDKRAVNYAPAGGASGTAMGGFAEGPAAVAARSLEGVNVGTADDPSIAGSVAPKRNAYTDMMQRSIEKSTPFNEARQQMQQITTPGTGFQMPKIKLPPMPGLTGGKSGA